MTNQREILQENNPFSSHTQPDPWVNQFPTISSINGDAFLTITRIISYKQTNPHDPVGILVKGEAGSGKTNMIARIREYCENTSFEVKFSTIRPIINYNTPIQHLFMELSPTYLTPYETRLSLPRFTFSSRLYHE